MPEEPPPGIQLAYWLEQLRADVAESVNGVVLRGARPVEVTNAGRRATRPTSSPGALVGFSLTSLQAAGGATIAVRIIDGPELDGLELFRVTLLPGESTREWFGPGGINHQGLTLLEGDGLAFRGTVFLRGVE